MSVPFSSVGLVVCNQRIVVFAGLFTNHHDWACIFGSGFLYRCFNNLAFGVRQTVWCVLYRCLIRQFDFISADLLVPSSIGFWAKHSRYLFINSTKFLLVSFSILSPSMISSSDIQLCFAFLSSSFSIVTSRTALARSSTHSIVFSLCHFYSWLVYG